VKPVTFIQSIKEISRKVLAVLERNLKTKNLQGQAKTPVMDPIDYLEFTESYMVLAAKTP